MGIRGVVVLVVAGLVTLAPASASAAEGDLDLSFNGSGIVKTPIGTAADAAHAVAIDPQGRIVVAGPAVIGGVTDFALARYNTDGTLDTSFGTGGKVTTPMGTGQGVANSVAIDSQGRIVVAGSAFTGADNDFALARYNTNGSLDTSFGNGGKVTTPIGSGDDFANSVAIDSQGRIVAAGQGGTAADFALTRYTPSGDLDSAFNGTGKVTTPIGSGSDIANSVAIDSQGRIVAAGSSSNGTNDDFALARYNANGTLDGAFNGTGKVTTPIGNSLDIALGIAIDPQGRIVAAGYTFGTTFDFALARYNPDGSLDGGFNGTGKVTTPILSSDDFAHSASIDSQGRIVAAGSTNTGPNDDFAVARYHSDGTLDSSFAGDGIQTTAIGTGNEGAFTGTVDAQDRPVAVGYTTGATDDFALVRYIGDATPPAMTITSGVADGGATNDTTPTFHFTANEANVSPVCRFDTDPFEACSHSTRQTADDLTEGSHSFSVRGTDRAGNVSAVASRTFTVDITPPDPSIKGKSAFTTKKKTGRATFTLAAGETGATLKCRIDGDTFTICPAGSFTTPKLAIGNHVIEVRSTDLAGNRGSSAKPFAIVKPR